MKQIQFANIAALAAVIALSSTASAVHAQASLAPPVSTTTQAPADQSVYSWKDVPLNQQIPITRAVFDQGGYQLYDTTGETIVVPFVNNNLYVMKFGQTNAGMYFVNDGVTPTLYVPMGGYLENSAAQGAKWYPFEQNFAYTQPVFVGPAPSWDAYVSMGWYPGMVYYGGYWGVRPYSVGVSFSPMPGLTFSIFGNTYHSWGDYHAYFIANPSRAIVIRSAPAFRFYGVAHRPFAVARPFGAAGHRPFGDGRAFGTYDAGRRGSDGRATGWDRDAGNKFRAGHDGGDHGGWGEHGGGDHGGGDHGGGDHGGDRGGDHGRP